MALMTQEQALAEARCRWGENAFAEEVSDYGYWENDKALIVGYYEYTPVKRFFFFNRVEKERIVKGDVTTRAVDHSKDWDHPLVYCWEEAFLDHDNRVKKAEERKERRRMLREAAEARLVVEFNSNSCVVKRGE